MLHHIANDRTTRTIFTSTPEDSYKIAHAPGLLRILQRRPALKSQWSSSQETYLVSCGDACVPRLRETIAQKKKHRPTRLTGACTLKSYVARYLIANLGQADHTGVGCTQEPGGWIQVGPPQSGQRSSHLVEDDVMQDVKCQAKLPIPGTSKFQLCHWSIRQAVQPHFQDRK